MYLLMFQHVENFIRILYRSGNNSLEYYHHGVNQCFSDIPEPFGAHIWC